LISHRGFLSRCINGVSWKGNKSETEAAWSPMYTGMNPTRHGESNWNLKEKESCVAAWSSLQ